MLFNNYLEMDTYGVCNWLYIMYLMFYFYCLLEADTTQPFPMVNIQEISGNI